MKSAGRETTEEINECGREIEVNGTTEPASEINVTTIEDTPEETGKISSENKNGEAPSLPVPVPAPSVDSKDPETSEDRHGTEAPDNSQKCKERHVAASKIISAVIGILFSSISLLYLAAQTVESADRLLSAGVGEILLDEVFGAVQPVVENENSGKEDGRADGHGPADTADEAEETKVETEETERHDPLTHPIAYESLANYSLLSELSNETSYTPDLVGLLAMKSGVGKCDGIRKEYGKDSPVVLIVHTHATEAYTPEGNSTYSEEDSFRTQNTDENVVAVGETVAQILEAEGIGVIHCTELFDAESYRESYSRSYAAVSNYISRYPSISYVLDIHRDSVFREDKTNVASYAEHNGKTCAQVMIVVGTDEGGAYHPGWKDNLSLALNIQQNMVSIEESVPRKINLRSAAFNQGLCSGSLLLEIGSCGNSLSEAKRAAVVAALAVAGAVKGSPASGNVDKLMSLYGDQN